MTQKAQILSHLKAGHRITGKDALDKFAIARLPPIILKLKQEGHNIERELIHVRNRFGAKCRVAEYRLADVKQRGLF